MDGLHVAFEGYVGGQPELRYLPSGKPLLQFALAVSDPKAAEKGQETTWVRCTAWEARAEELQNTLTKGCEVYVEGKLTTSTWETRDGEKRFGLNCSCWRVEILGRIGKAGRKPRESDPQPRQQNGRDIDAAAEIPF